MDELVKLSRNRLRCLMKESVVSLENALDELAREGETGKKRLLEHDIYFIEPEIVLMMYQTYDEWSRLRKPSAREKVSDGVRIAYWSLKNILW